MLLLLPASALHVPRTDRPPDLQGGDAQPHLAGHQEGQAPLRAQLLPSQGLPLELRRLPPGTMANTSPIPEHARTLTVYIDMGGPQRRPPGDQGQG